LPDVASTSKITGKIDKKEELEIFPETKRTRIAQRPLSLGKKKIDLPLDLLDNQSSQPTSGDIKARTIAIQKTLENFGIPVEMGKVQVGPTVTQYTLRPAEGIKLSRITALHNDLALALASHPIRIEAPIPGKSLVGIEVPNQAVALVRLREILESEEFKKRKSNLSIALGKDVAGHCWLADLEKMPHLLIAGATGSGKTTALNSVVVSLLYQNSPRDLKFILIDPKRVEFPIYNDLPHLLTPVVTDVKKTINALHWTIQEMDRRFNLFSETKARDIKNYNTSQEEELPYIVVVIDELADLMASAPREIEACIIRLSQMARATGIHLVVATQRPSVDIITGLIKANITSRVAFSVASIMDSRTILDFSGAEKLLGRGDMLFISSWLSRPKRLQGAFVGDKEIEVVVDFLKEKAEPEYEEKILEKIPSVPEEETDFSALKEDELLPEARETVLRYKKASASLLQRRLRIGYARAARLLDLLEEQGIISPVDGAKPREILVDTENAEEKFDKEENFSKIVGEE
jgi:S-DNA-T family DNA segregation ATPase FtsK/SpoIIIE